MHRFAIAAALAVLAVGAMAAPARANQMLAFEIVGAGTVAAGPDAAADHLAVICSQAPVGPPVGACAERGFTGEPTCFPDTDPPICVPTAGLTFKATPADGFTFTGWSHPQCVPQNQNPCGVQVGTNDNDPVLQVTATFADTQADRKSVV